MNLLKDIRYGVRSLLQQPTFTVVAVITLAIGVGANTALFSVIQALVLTPPAIAEADRVVAIWKTPRDKRLEGLISYLDLQEYRTRNHSFEDIAGYKPNRFNLQNNDEMERIEGMRVTANFFPLLRVRPLHGRNFTPEEEQRGSQPVVIISYECWQNRFGRGEVLGRQMALNNKSFTIIGVLPPRFEFPLLPKPAEVWTTVSGEGSNLTERGAQVLRAMGRLKPSITLPQADADMATIAVALGNEYPGSNGKSTIYLVGAHEQIVGPEVRRALWLLFGAVAFLLLIACTNTANLLLVRATARQREVAIRAAVGAGRWQIARQLLTESFLLSMLSTMAGLLFANWGLGAIRYFGADQLPRLQEVQINGRVLFFTTVISIVTTLLFSVLPIFKGSRADVNELLSSGSRGATSDRSLRLWRDSLVVAEIAVSLILLVGAGLMIRSFAGLVNVPPGFDPHNVLTGQISLTQPIYEKPEECANYIDRVLERLRAIPGVENAAFVAPMPFSGGNVGSDFRIEGRPVPSPGTEPTANNRSVTSQYFQTMRIPLVKGRFFSESDKRGGVGAAIINQTLAQRYFPNEDPIGKRISHIGANQNEGDPAQFEIVGIVGDVHHSSLIKAATPEIYLPHRQNPWGWGNFVARTTVDPTSLAQTFRQEIHAVDKSAPITNVQPLTQAISETVAQSRFYTFLFGLFGVLGLVLTMTGVYGVISYTVSQRTKEIGIRIALGATAPGILRLVLRQGLLLASVGAALGLIASFALARVIVSLLFGIRPTDLFSFAIASAVLLASALVASYLPARRATKVDPLVALRYE